MYVFVSRSVLRKGPGGWGGGPVASQSLCVNRYNRWALGQVVTFLTILACGYASAALWHLRACFCRQPPVSGGRICTGCFLILLLNKHNSKYSFFFCFFSFFFPFSGAGMGQWGDSFACKLGEHWVLNRTNCVVMFRV